MKDMGSSYERLLRALPEESCSSHLCERVVGRILWERSRLVRERLVLSSLSGIGSLLLIVWTGMLFVQEASASGFSAYASLLLTDGGVVGRQSASFALLLLETLPKAATFLALLAAAVLLISARGIALYLPKVRVAGMNLFLHRPA